MRSGPTFAKYADVHIGGSVSPAYRTILFGNNPLVGERFPYEPLIVNP